MRRVFQSHLTDRPDALDLVETGTLTSNTSSIEVRFVNSDFRSYEIVLDKIAANLDGNVAQIRVSISGAFGMATAANYRFASNFLTSAGFLTGFATGASAMNLMATGANLELGAAAGEGFGGLLYIDSPNIATEHTLLRWELAYATELDADYSVQGSGRYLATQSVTAISVFMLCGNFQRGAYYVYGRRNP